MRYSKTNCIILLCVVGIYSCSTRESKIADNTSLETARDSIAIEVATAVAVQKPFNFLISSSGKIVSKREDLVNSPINGKLITCIAVDGKSVLKNEVIVQFDTRPILFKKERAILHKYNTEKEYESVLLGYENLLKGKNEASADSIKNKLRIGVGLADAQQDLVEANYELMNAQVIAPFNGLIANVLVHSGQTVKSGQEMFRIYDPNELFLTIKVLESDLSLIKLGFVAQIFPLSFEKEHYSATVASINPYVEETGMIVVLLRVDNAHGPAGNRLFPGMNCTATISIPCPSSIVVPKEAIVNRSGRSVVFTVLENKAVWNYVTTGRDNGKEIEILSGVTKNERVIISNNLQLSHNTSVKDITKILKRTTGNK